MKFGLIGAAHPHAVLIARHLLESGARFAGVADADAALAPALRDLGAPPSSREALLGAPDVELIVCAGIPAERAPLAIAALEAGKHVLAAKPALLDEASVDAVERAAAAADRRFLVCFTERVLSRATLRALSLVRDGAIGDVVHLTGFGPHRLNAAARPEWFFDPRRAGGILTDLASHQMDQFLSFCAIEPPAYPEVEVVAAECRGSAATPAGFDDFGEVLIRAPGCSAYVRVDWLSPEGLPTWGDVRLFLVGSSGSIEVRKNIDLAGRPGGDHVLLADAHGVQAIDTRGDRLRYGETLIDALGKGGMRNEQAQGLFASRLAVRAQSLACRGREPC